MPTKEEVRIVFESITVNGLDFIERSAGELEEAPKFSIAHFATGLELLLKARLFAEHWSLTATDPHACSWTGLKDGSVHTVQASDLCAAITNTTGTSFQHSKATFASVFAHRNKALHWIPAENIEEAAAEQCRAWYLLHQLLTTTWSEYFARFKEQIDAVDKSLLIHRTYLNARYKELENKLKGPNANGALFMCPACSFKSGVMQSPGLRISDFACPVCQTKGSAGRFECSQWHALDKLPEACSCGETHDRKQLLDDLDPASYMSPRDQSIEGQTLYSCGECYEQQTVAPIDDTGESTLYACAACGAQFNGSHVGGCDYCGELWIGYSNEDTAYSGCEFCDGPSFQDD